MIERFSPSSLIHRPSSAGVDRLGVDRAGDARPEGPARGLAAAAPAPAGAVAAELSGLAAEMAKSPPVNEARVAQLREQLATGAYEVDPAAVADAMIRSLTDR